GAPGEGTVGTDPAAAKAVLLDSAQQAEMGRSLSARAAVSFPLALLSSLGAIYETGLYHCHRFSVALRKRSGAGAFFCGCGRCTRTRVDRGSSAPAGRSFGYSWRTYCSG